MEVEFFQFLAKFYGLRQSEGPIAVGQQSDLAADRFANFCDNGQLAVQFKAATASLERLVTTLNQFCGFGWELILGTNAVGIVHGRSVGQYLVAQAAAVQVGDRLADCLAAQVVQSNIDAAHGAAIAKIWPPQRAPQLTMLQRIF